MDHIKVLVHLSVIWTFKSLSASTQIQKQPHDISKVCDSAEGNTYCKCDTHCDKLFGRDRQVRFLCNVGSGGSFMLAAADIATEDRAVQRGNGLASFSRPS